MIDALFTALKEQHLVLFVGAGFSFQAGIPGGGRLADMLKKEFKPNTQSNRLDEVASAVEFSSDDHEENRLRMISFLREEFDRCGTSSEAHEITASIPYIDTVITTNYDGLFESAYQDRASIIYNQHTLVESEKAKNKVKVYKIHGDFRDPDTIILTQEDYEAFIAGQEKNLMFNRLKDIFATCSILFIGYSMADINILAAWKWVGGIINENTNHHYLVAPGFSDVQQRQLMEKGITYIESCGEPILQQLYSRCKETMIHDMENGRLSFQDVANITKQNAGFVPVIHSEGVNIYTAGVQFVDDKDDVMDISMELMANSTARERINSILRGETIDTVNLSAQDIARVTSMISGYTIFDHSNVDLAVIVPLPDFEGTVQVFFGKQIFPVDAYGKLFRRNKGFRLIVEFPYMTVTLNIWINNTPPYRANYRYAPAKTLLEKARLFSELHRFFSFDRICVSIPTLDTPYILATESICSTEQYTRLRSTVETLNRYFSDLLEIQQQFSTVFDADLDADKSYDDLRWAQLIAGIISKKYCLCAKEYYLDVNEDERITKEIEEVERIEINVLDFSEYHCNLYNHHFHFADFHLEPFKARFVRKERLGKGINRLWYKPHRGLLRIGGKIILDDGINELRF